MAYDAINTSGAKWPDISGEYHLTADAAAAASEAFADEAVSEFSSYVEKKEAIFLTLALSTHNDVIWAFSNLPKIVQS